MRYVPFTVSYEVWFLSGQTSADGTGGKIDVVVSGDCDVTTLAAVLLVSVSSVYCPGDQAAGELPGELAGLELNLSTLEELCWATLRIELIEEWIDVSWPMTEEDCPDPPTIPIYRAPDVDVLYEKVPIHDFS